jgi:hypothetical protein
MESCYTDKFWELYTCLPISVQKQADRALEHLESNPRYPSLHFKCVNQREAKYSIRIGITYDICGTALL